MPEDDSADVGSEKIQSAHCFMHQVHFSLMISVSSVET